MPCPDTSARLAARRAQLALLDTTLICACERAAGHGRRNRLPPPDPARWDRSTWHRYLCEARTQDRILGGRMRQIQSDIIHLERLDHCGAGRPGGGALLPSALDASIVTAYLARDAALSATTSN